MNICYVYKWGRDPEDAYVREDGSIKWRVAKLQPSDDDAAAIAAVRTLTAGGGDEVCGLTIGDGDVVWAASRGVTQLKSASSLQLVDDEGDMAEELAATVRAAGDFDLVIMGDEQASAGVAGLMAAKLGLPLVAGMNDLEAGDEPGVIVGHRKSGKSIQELRIKAPALVTVEAVEDETDVPSIKQMLAAKKTPVETLEVEAETSGRTKVESVRVPETVRATIFEGEPAEATEQLVAALRADGIL